MAHLLEYDYEPGVGDTDETDTPLRIWFVYIAGYAQLKPGMSHPGEPGVGPIVKLDHIEALIDGEWVETNRFDEWAVRFLDCHGFDMACEIAEGL